MAGKYSDEEMEKIFDKVSTWSRVFAESPYFENMTEEQKEESGFIISTFSEYMYTYHGSRPNKWDEGDLRACCLNTLPRKITADESYYRSIAPVLSAFFIFLEKEGLLKGTALLAKKVTEIDKQIVKKSNDPSNWGMAKSIMMSAKKRGVNLEDKREMEDFLVDLQQRQLASLTEKRKRPEAAPPKASIEYKPKPNPKVGRNDPCPCGSGKKYKKCCGQ